MKSKILTLILSFTMVAGMSVPAFATNNIRTKDLMLAVVGDSIGAGCINPAFAGAIGGTVDPDDEDEKAFRRYVEFNEGEKNFDCAAVKLSFTSKLYHKMEASRYSKNLTFPGLRSKDLCAIIGVTPMKDGDYEDLYTGYMKDVCNMDQLNNEVNAKQYLTAIKHADAIVCELGENDITACLANSSDRPPLDRLSELLAPKSPSQETVREIAQDVKTINEEIRAGRTGHRYQEALLKLEQDIKTLKAIGEGFAQLVDLVVDMFQDLIVQSSYYGNAFLKFLHENVKSNAIVVVCSMIDPFKDAQGELEMLKILDVAIGPYIKSMNLYYRGLCKKYGFEFADVTAVSLNPGGKFFIHPNEEDQQLICDTVFNIIERKATKYRKAKLGVKTAVIGNKKATYLKEGFTGDEVCTDCGEVILKGSVIPKLMPNPSEIRKLVATHSGIAVKWTTARSVDGYQLQCSSSDQFDKNTRTITIINARDNDKYLWRLMSDQEYNVRIRTYKYVKKSAFKTVRVYSEWSEAKSIKTGAWK